MSDLPYGPPLPVSPLIRGARWGLFFAGFIYAQGKRKLYSVLAEQDRKHAAIRKAQHDRELAIIKARKALDPWS